MILMSNKKIVSPFWPEINESCIANKLHSLKVKSKFNLDSLLCINVSRGKKE